MPEKTANQGLHGAHTPAEIGQGGGGTARREAEAVQIEAGRAGSSDQGAAQGVEGDQGDQLEAFDVGLFEPEGDNALPLPIDAREIGDQGKRARGRPKGSANKSTTDMRRFLLAQGFRDPMQALASAYSMDTMALARRLSAMREAIRREYLDRGYEAHMVDQVLPSSAVDPLEVYKLQLAAARDAMPYWHAKQTPDDTPPPSQIPVMVIGQLNGNMQVNAGSMSAGTPGDVKDEQYQRVKHGHGQGESVRRQPVPSHDASEVIENKEK